MVVIQELIWLAPLELLYIVYRYANATPEGTLYFSFSQCAESPVLLCYCDLRKAILLQALLAVMGKELGFFTDHPLQ